MKVVSHRTFSSLAAELGWNAGRVVGIRDIEQLAVRLLPAEDAHAVSTFFGPEQEAVAIADEIRARLAVASLEGAFRPDFWIDTLDIALEAKAVGWDAAENLIRAIRPVVLRPLLREIGGSATAATSRRCGALRLLGDVGDLTDGLILWLATESDNLSVQGAGLDGLERLARRCTGIFSYRRLNTHARGETQPVWAAGVKILALLEEHLRGPVQDNRSIAGGRRARAQRRPKRPE